MIYPIRGEPATTHTTKLESGPRPQMSHDYTVGTITNSVQAGPHSPLSSPVPRGMAQEAKH